MTSQQHFSKGHRSCIGPPNASPECRNSRAVKDLLVVNNSYENTDVMNSNFISSKSGIYRSILENCSNRGGLDDIRLASVSILYASVGVLVHASIHSSINSFVQFRVSCREGYGDINTRWSLNISCFSATSHSFAGSSAGGRTPCSSRGSR